MVQADRDPLTGARRDDVFMSAEDATALGLAGGDRVLVRSAVGQLEGRCKIVPIKPRNVQVFWPEANALIARGATDPQCGIPDYHTLVEIVPIATPAVSPEALGASSR
jgi:anaerobic selenocysteine-containing dehydrogenase